MTSFRPVALAALLGALATVPTASSASFPELRRDHESIDAALASAPNASLHGALNHASALLERAPVADLGTGDFELLSASFERTMTRALGSIHEGTADALPHLTLDEQAVLVQVLDAVLFERLVELYTGAAVVPCSGEDCDTTSQLLHRLDDLAASLEPVLRDLLQAYNDARDPSAPPAVLPGPGDVNESTFGAWVDDVRDTYLAIGGIESIDS